MVEASLFIGTAVVAVTQFVKSLVPRIQGPATILLAAIVGLLVAVIDTHIGVQDISIATGILAGLSGAGIVTVAQKVNG